MFCGDFYQLEPPGGTPLNAIPTSWVRKARQYAPSAGEDHGHCIFWGEGRGSVSGMTELVECKRLEGHDEWFLNVQDELRRGSLSERTHQFLHGRPTDVAGSWVGCGPTCGSEQCTKNAEAIARDNGQECGHCQAERRRRQLVATGPDDERFLLPEFVKATAIYPNQDVKCKVARQRAVDWAASEGKQISWVYARDAARHGTFQQRPYTSSDKVRWLGYHDKACADMPGWLPLAVGMPVVLTDHLDRGEKQLLRGCHATIHSWVVDEDEGAVADAAEVTLRRMPRQIVLDFHTDAWTLKSMPGPGLYPIAPRQRVWFLDAYRKKPVLGVRRKQFLISPGLASTAHAAQGRSLDAVIADLQEGRNVSWMSSYVAITRVKTRRGLLIYRPFELKPYTQGEMEGTKHLLAKLRGEEVPWAEIEAELMPRKVCSRCSALKEKAEFTPTEFKGKDGPSFCRECTEELKEAGEKWCTECKTWAALGPRTPENEARGGRVFVRTSKCERCAGPATARKSRKESGAWQEKVQEKFKIRCAKCKNFLKTEAEVAANQYDSKGAGEKFCRTCARDEPQAKAEAANRKRKAEADAKPLTCAACGGAFADTKHLKQTQKEHRKATGKRVVCGDCSKRDITAKDVADEAKRLKRLLTCATCKKEFARQQHISAEQESKHFTRKSKVVCASCVADGFNARNWLGGSMG